MKRPWTLLVQLAFTALLSSDFAVQGRQLQPISHINTRQISITDFDYIIFITLRFNFYTIIIALHIKYSLPSACQHQIIPGLVPPPHSTQIWTPAPSRSARLVSVSWRNLTVRTNHENLIGLGTLPTNSYSLCLC